MYKIFIRILLCLIFSSAYAGSSHSIVIQNEYFPKPGKEKEVYGLRMQAPQILVKLGVPKGRVLKRQNLGDRPYMMWECEYASAEERERIIKIVSQSMEFKKVETKMEKLINHFDRITWETTGT